MPAVNHELQLANDFVQSTGTNIFLTGKAGTGKTTFLKNLHQATAKRLIITAPTGVAAINAGGVTLHSFFQLPFGPFVPGSEAYEQRNRRQFRFSKEKKNIIQSLDLLVIDEISMVRADLLDSIDSVLRRHRRNNQPFGGVQLLMIGDLHQLSPVARQNEWHLLQQHYPSVYFFSSHALEQTELITIELKHIYRQSDSHFIDILNRVRENRLDQAALASLNARVNSHFTPNEDDGYITLTTHNRSADTINHSRLQALPGKTFRFEADISGDFPEKIYPTQSTLVLKEGAQVMFIRNDSSPDKLYYNGKIGRISKISRGSIRVICEENDKPIVVEPISWENIKYSLNDESKEIEEKTIGSFEQFPLKLAWAITIHKSQGLTFNRAIIDAADAFTHGQVYVALSRCKTLEGIVLSSPITSGGVSTDDEVLQFDRNSLEHPPSADRLQAAKNQYQQSLLLGCFTFLLIRKRLGYLVHLLLRNSQVVQLSGLNNIRDLEQQAVKNIFLVSDNFRHELNTLFATTTLPETDPKIIERIGKASHWFQQQFATLFTEQLLKLHIETDNKELRKTITNTFNNLKKEIAIRLAGICCCETGFSPTAYLRAVSVAEIDFQPEKQKKNQPPAYTEVDIDHPELFQTLREWRSKKAEEMDVPHYQIMHQRVLIQIVVCLPDNPADLRKIKGVGKKTLEKYGEELIAMVTTYRKKEKIEAVFLKEPKEVPGGSIQKERSGISPTQQISLELFNQGKTLAQVAEARGLAISTIESHLSSCITTGELEIDQLLSEEKQQVIAKALGPLPVQALSPIKQELGDDYSYGEIKMMLNHLNHQASIQHPSDENE